MNKLLEMRHISKSFPGVKALDTVSFELEKDEVHVLVGYFTNIYIVNIKFIFLY